MSFLFPKAPKIPTPPATTTTGAAEENASQAERLRRMRAKGYLSNQLTAGKDLATPILGRKRLFGE